jgi:hypothetical protein
MRVGYISINNANSNEFEGILNLYQANPTKISPVQVKINGKKHKNNGYFFEVKRS